MSRQPMVTDLEQAERYLESLTDEQQLLAVRELVSYWRDPGGLDTFVIPGNPPQRDQQSRGARQCWSAG